MEDDPAANNVSFTLSSPAKINVFLEVLGKRDDGFHELETVMLRTSFCDTIRFSHSEHAGAQLALASGSAVGSDQFPLDESNLILKAANALMDHVKATFGASMEVLKQIPSQAGLAGGSSNAATTLIGLNRLWNLGLTKDQLHDIAAGLGSDLNFFIEDCPAAICRGRGERVEAIPMDGTFHFVAVHPGVGNSTPEVFARLTAASSVQTSFEVVDSLLKGDSARLSSSIFNRLTQAASECNSEMRSLLQTMESVTGNPAFMSGSGSTCFVIAHSHDHAVEIEKQLLTHKAGLVMRLTCGQRA